MLDITKDFSYIIKIISLLFEFYNSKLSTYNITEQAEMLINGLRLLIYHQLTGLEDALDLDTPNFEKIIEIIEIRIMENNQVLSVQNNFSLLFDFDLLINNFDLKAIYLTSSNSAITFEDILNNKYTFIATLKNV
jgi:hypothetical protein